jgi:hypothetical protein
VAAVQAVRAHDPFLAIMRIKRTGESNVRRWQRYLSLAAEAGALVMNMRDTPRPLDWVAFAMRGVGLAWKIHAEHRAATAGDPWSYFDDDGPGARWVEVPSELARQTLDHVEHVRVLETHWSGEDGAERVCLGVIDTETVGWIAERGEELVGGPYVLAERQDETYRAIGLRVWRSMGTRHVAFTGRGLTTDCMDDADIVVPENLEELRLRLRAFRDHGLGRGVLLIGPPGTGKSHAIRWIARQLDLCTLRVELGSLVQIYGYRAEEGATAGLEALTKILQPEAIIIDDIDRVGTHPRLLSLLEDAARSGRFVLASANCTDKMLGAMLRPGRFDDLVRFEGLDPRVLAALLAPDEDLAPRFADAPIAYVQEFVKRRRVLGRARALSEIDELIERLRTINRRTDEGQ